MRNSQRRRFCPKAAIVFAALAWSFAAAAGPAVKKKAPAPQAKAKPPPPAPPPVPTKPMAEVLENVGERVTGVLLQATRVQTWRVGSTGGLQPDKARAIGTDFQRDLAGKELGEVDLAALRGVLFDTKSYRFDQDVSKCDFAPNVSFQAQSGLDTVEVLVSFKCAQVLYFIGKPGGRWLPGGTFDVKPARAKLLELAKATLPQDPPTQALK